MIEQILAFLLALLFLPIFFLISVAIFIEDLISSHLPASIIYTEERISEGKPFKLYKFRTFKREAIEKRRDRFSTYGVTAIENKKDSLTRVGRFLKKVYFDELPQLINIIKGEMRFVGPRPLIRPLYEEFKQRGDRAKDALKAGLTGPWQIRKGQIGTKEEIIAAENAYLEDVKNLNTGQRLLYDLKIIGKTFRVIWEAKSI